MRRVFIISATIIVLLGVGVVAYFYFFGSSPSVTTTTPTETVGLPSSSGVNPSPSASSTASTPAPIPTTTSSPRLVKVSPGPVVFGEVLVDTKQTASSSADTVLEFIERQSGNVFSYGTQSKTLTRTSNKTIPGIQSASWLPDGSAAVVRYLSGTDFSTINNYILSANGSGGSFLPQNLADVSTSATGLLSLASGVSGSAASLAHTDGTHPTTLFTTPLSSVRASFAGKGKYLVFTKPAAELLGDAFIADSSGHLSRVAGPLPGLAALSSPSGKWVLVSFSLNNSLRMELVNVSTGETMTLPIASIADKCVWSADESVIYCGIPISPPSAAYPDAWYQGVVSFSDRVWKINVAGRYAQLLLDFNKEVNSLLDATALAVNPSNTVLVFVNKNDGSLWSYTL